MCTAQLFALNVAMLWWMQLVLKQRIELVFAGAQLPVRLAHMQALERLRL
jgi:hypothetical protein